MDLWYASHLGVAQVAAEEAVNVANRAAMENGRKPTARMPSFYARVEERVRAIMEGMQARVRGRRDVACVSSNEHSRRSSHSPQHAHEVERIAQNATQAPERWGYFPGLQQVEVGAQQPPPPPTAAPAAARAPAVKFLNVQESLSRGVPLTVPVRALLRQHSPFTCRSLARGLAQDTR